MSKFDKKTKIIIIVILITVSLIYCFISKKVKNENLNRLNSEELSVQEENNEIYNSTNDKNKENKIMVHIAGAVNKEGIYELEEGERIADIIEKAEGLTKEANLNNINLAYKLEDGMKIYIPKINEESSNTSIYEENETKKYNVKENINKKEENQIANYNKESKVNINTSTQTELETLPGIGTSTALKIIDYRKTKGKFKKIEDIKNVNGIGESKYEKIKDLIKI